MRFRSYEMLRYLQLLTRVFHERDVRSIATVMLLELGIPADSDGFQYLRSAIEMRHADPMANFTKGIYPKVARFYRTGDGWKHVDQAIRRSVRAAWNGREAEKWELFFLRNCGKMAICPSNKVFISQISSIIELCQKCREADHERVT